MKIGTQEIKKIYLKDYEVQKIYQGTIEIYSALIEPYTDPYLLASKKVKLAASKSSSLYYTNTPQILEDTLSNTGD